MTPDPTTRHTPLLVVVGLMLTAVLLWALASAGPRASVDVGTDGSHTIDPL